MRLLTVNLLNGEASPDDLERVLDVHDPDLVLAQELAPNAGTVLERRFPHGAVKPNVEYSGKAIAARFPIAVEELDFPFRTILRGETPDGLEILNVHLANPIDGWRGRIPERRAQVRALEAIVRHPRRRVVAGDFNSTHNWPAYKRIVRYLDDTVADHVSESGQQLPRTWGWRPGWPAMLRIDHVFAQGLAATAVKVVTVRGTDHRAVIVDLAPSA